MFNYEQGVVYTFNTLAPALLGATFKNAKFMAKMDYETAAVFDPNLDLKFRQIYPLLPPNTPDSPESCSYIRVLTESGEKIILAAIWIDENTIDTIEKIAFQVTFPSSSLKIMANVRDALNTLDAGVFTIKQIQP